MDFAINIENEIERVKMFHKIMPIPFGTPKNVLLDEILILFWSIVSHLFYWLIFIDFNHSLITGYASCRFSSSLLFISFPDSVIVIDNIVRCLKTHLEMKPKNFAK